jgi:hypothetical protein
MKKIFLSLMVAMSAGLLCLAQNCDNNFPNADIATAQRIYKFETFTEPSLGGAGNNPDEINLFAVNLSKLKETHSAWYAFEIKDPGNLTFRIKPNTALDDIDFVLYQEISGVWQVVGTSTSGPLLNVRRKSSTNTYIQGTVFTDDDETGVKDGGYDLHEMDGVAYNPLSSDGYLETIPVLANQKFRLVVNNYFSCDGFTIYWNENNTTNVPTLKPCESLSVIPVIKHKRECEGNGEISLIVNGNGNYTYKWSNNFTGSTLVNPTPNIAYAVTVTDNAGCKVQLSNLQIANYLKPTLARISDITLTCSAAIATAVATPTRSGQSYLWKGANGLLPSNSNILGINTPGSITVTLIDAESTCSVTQTFGVTGTISNIAVPDVTVAGNLTCTKTSTTVGINNLCTGCTVTWTSADGTGLNGAATATGTTAAVTKEGSYTATMKNASQCSNVKQFTVSKDMTAPTFSLPSDLPIACVNPSTIISIANPNSLSNTYAWSASNGGLIQGSTTGLSVTAIKKGTYNVTATNVSTGCKATKQVQVAEPNIMVSPTPISGVCRGTMVQFIPVVYGGQAPYTYTWSPATVLSNPTVLEPFFMSANLPTSTNFVDYHIQVKDAGGCVSNIGLLGFPIHPKPNITQIGANSLPNGEQLEPNISGGTGIFTYQWLPSTGLNSAVIEQPVADPLSSTTYTLTATDSKGCSAQANKVVTVNKPFINPITDLTVCEGMVVTFSPSAIGGTLPYTWQVGTNGVFSSLNATPYIVTATVTTVYSFLVTDSNQKVHNRQVTLTVLPRPTVDLGPDITICAGQSVKLTPTIIGDQFQLAPFNWTPNQTLSSTNLFAPYANPVVTTSYALNLVRKNGCTSIEHIIVHVSPLPNGHISYSNGVLEAHSNAGTPPRTYIWTPSNETSTTLVPSSNTTNYSLKITDAEGCTATASYTLQLPISIRGKVFWDFNRNGISDAGETNVHDLWVNLLKPDNSVQSRVKTDLLGSYAFLNAPYGQYHISFDLHKTGIIFSPKDQGNNDAIDSDTNIDGKTDLIWAGSPTFDLTHIDAGLIDIEPPTILSPPVNLTVNSNTAWTNGVNVAQSITYHDNGVYSVISNTSSSNSGTNCTGKFYKRTWTLTDKFNNASTALYCVYLKDTAPPVISSTPNNITVACTGLAAEKNITGITATDLVDNSVVPIVSFLTISSTITRQVWTATDDCGNSSIKDRYITTPTACNGSGGGGSTIQSKSSVNVNSTHPIHVVAMPNPTTGMVKIELSLKEKNTAAFELYDFSGRLLWRDQTRLEDTYFLEEVDLSSLPNGIYLLRANSGTNTITERIIKQ